MSRGVRLTLFVVIALLVAGIVTSPRVGAIVDALTPPRLPPLQQVAGSPQRFDQNWKADDAERFHFEPQGTRTLPVPLSWFLALEEPLESPFSIPFGKRGRFADNSYLLRFGFIGAEKSRHNPGGLPIGFAASPFQTISGLSRKETAIGLTCAACHTGQLVHNGKRYIVEGGPAVTDLGQLTFALGAALGQTAASAKLPHPLDGRFERFARAVLQDRYNDITRNQLADELASVLNGLVAEPNGVAVTEGFSRLDALNRIGNQVFAVDTKRYGNAVDVNAPVNFPHIWTASWFDWVQYDASIMQPLVRNAGEAMGVRAHVIFDAPHPHGGLASNIPFNNLDWIETLLAGDRHPAKERKFGGLHAPRWPSEFGSIDQAKAAIGAKLYKELCVECHRPALTPEIARGGAPGDEFWTYFKPIRWRDLAGAEKETANAYYRVMIKSQKDIGTDPAQGEVLAKRKVDTAGTALTRTGEYGPGLGIAAEVCVARRKGGIPEMVKVTDGAMQDYPAALGAVVHMAIDEWARGKPKSETASVRDKFEDDRPNCLQAGAGYKARPLNGIWATAPFLHNGSVPTLYHLLSPVWERPKAFLLGNPGFDPVRVGIVTVEPGRAQRDRAYDEQGYFILDTSKPGNRNTGHEFVDRPKVNGVIGRALSPEERSQIIEYLKTL
jgi:mono/diheme cytochrome c family protein